MGSENLSGIEAMIREQHERYDQALGKLTGIKNVFVEKAQRDIAEIEGISEVKIKEVHQFGSTNGVVTPGSNFRFCYSGTQEAENKAAEVFQSLKEKLIEEQAPWVTRVARVRKVATEYMNKLRKYVEINPVYEGCPTQEAYILILRKDGFYIAEMGANPRFAVLDSRKLDLSKLESAKAIRAKNVYMVTHPSELVNQDSLFAEAVKYVSEKLAKKSKVVRTRKCFPN